MTETVQPRIGVLLDHIESDYHTEILAGVLRAARQRRARIVIVPGGAIAKPGVAPIARNFIFDLISSTRLDGLIVLAGSLANYCGSSQLRNWLTRFERFPIVTVQLELPPLPSVHLDNGIGVYAVVSHLIEVHHRQRIAFLRGPEESAEAEARRGAYQRALTDHGLRVDDRLITPPGGFGREDGLVGIQTLFDDRRLTPAMLDAIVGANDQTALGAVEELTRRGISVPDQVAVTGFDDAPTARTSNPALTTVNQMVELQGFTAARSLLEALAGGRKPASTKLDSAVVLRRSCGCVTPFLNNSRAVRPLTSSLTRSCRLGLIERRSTITSVLSRAAAGRLFSMSGWDGKLLDSLTQELGDPIGGAFLREAERMSRRSIGLGSGGAPLHDVLTALRLQALSCAALEPEVRPRLEDLFQEARYMLACVVTEMEREQTRVANHYLRLITKACLLASSSRSTSELVPVLSEQLPALGVQAYSVGRFSGKLGLTPELEIVARRVTGLWPQKLLKVPAANLGLDPAFESEEALIVQPLDFGDQPVGLAVFSWGAQNPLVYEQLRDLLSVALHATATPEA